MNYSDLSFTETFAGFQVFYTSRCGSTQDLIKELPQITGIKNEPLCLYTFDQYSGKGQRGSQWLSEAGKNLAMSVIIPENRLNKVSTVVLNKLIALSVLESIRLYCETATLKWPNDVRKNQRKIAGILTEYVHNLKGAAQYCTGVGININQTDFSLIEQEATSVRNETGMEIQITDLLHHVLRNLQTRCFKPVTAAEVHEQFNQSLEGINELWMAETESGIIRAILKGIDPDGRAVLLLNNGHLHHLHHGQVRLLRQC